MKKFISQLAIAVMGGAVAIGAFHLFQPDTPVISEQAFTPQSADVQFVNMPNSIPGNAVDFRVAAEKSINAVVHVKTLTRRYGYARSYDPFSFFWGGEYSKRELPPARSSGSGVIISDDGYIVTNNHVIDNATEIEVTLNNKRTYTAKIIGTDPATDLALLKVEDEGLPFITYGNSDHIDIGEWVLAVGNPFNLTSTVTAGIVSAKGRDIDILKRTQDVYPLESFIQTDAAVNPGNSGGALVNTHGELVGINAAIASTTGSYAGYSFAIPVNIVNKVVKDLVEYGDVQRAFIGVNIQDIDKSLAEKIGIDDLNGIYVAGLLPEGAAMEAGMKEGDIITRVGSITVKNVTELQEQIGKYRPGDKINVGVKRDNKEVSLPLILRNKKGTTRLEKKSEKAEIFTMLGANFETMESKDLGSLGLSHGIRVKQLNPGKLRSSGIREGFIITEIDNIPMRSVKDIESALSNKKGGVLIEGLYPNGTKAYYGFGM